MEPEVAADDTGTGLATIGDRQPAMRFPPRYRGAFKRDFAIGHDPGAGQGALRQPALSQPARDMLELKLGPQAAARLIACVERMAAAAASLDCERENGR